MKSLVDKESSFECHFYIGAIKNSTDVKSQRLFNGQRKLLQHLKDCGVTYHLGYLLKNNGVFHEKGVDVQMAVDLVVAGYEKSFSRAFLISSDTDLLPAIRQVKKQIITVTYVGFKQQPSRALMATCDSTGLLDQADIKKFLS